MKDHRFIELVNLYVDRQISADETGELETEIQNNPQRRAVYRHYCQVHRATTLVFDSFRAQAPEQAAAESAGHGTIARFESRQRHRRNRWAYYAGGLAAAACLTLVFVRLNSPVASGSAAEPAIVQASAASVQIATTTQPATTAMANARQPLLVKFGPASLRNVAEPDYASLVAALRQEERRNVEIAPTQVQSLFEDGVFETGPGMPVTNQRTYRSRQTPAQQAEFTAFQFQR